MEPGEHDSGSDVLKTAFITGISGQDGAYLSRHLLQLGYRVIGGDRVTSSGSLWRLKTLNILESVEVIHFDLGEFSNIYEVLEKYDIDEVYNLAAQSSVAASFEMPTLTADCNGMGALRILDVIRKISPETRFYQASSSEMFGNAAISPQNESTPFHPRSPYAVSKLMGHWSAVNYRESYKMFSCSGILFNHESPLRGDEYVTKKICRAVADIHHDRQEFLEVGNIQAKRDWGFAGDYVRAMHMMLQQKSADDFVIGTGKSRTVQAFIEACFQYVGSDLVWEGKGLSLTGRDKSGKCRVKINPKFFRPAEADNICADAAKARKILKWQPEYSFEDLIAMMMDYELER